jgi:hypothetical protein
LQLTRSGRYSSGRARAGALRPLRFEDDKRETLRDLLGDEDYQYYYGPDPTADTAAGQRRGWWGVYGLVVMMILMMATLAWAWVDRDGNVAHPSPPPAGAPAPLALHGGR